MFLMLIPSRMIRFVGTRQRLNSLIIEFTRQIVALRIQCAQNSVSCASHPGHLVFSTLTAQVVVAANGICTEVISAVVDANYMTMKDRYNMFRACQRERLELRAPGNA